MIDVRPTTLERGRHPPRAADRGPSRRARGSGGRRPALGAVVHDRARRRRAWRPTSPTALQGQRDGHMLPWVVRDLSTGAHRRLDALSRHRAGHRSGGDRLHVVRARAGSAATSTRPASCSCSRTRSTRSAARWWGCGPTTSTSARSGRSKGWARRRTACIRHHAARRDGSVRDTVMYSILAAEWPDVRRHLESRLQRHGDGA